MIEVKTNIVPIGTKENLKDYINRLSASERVTIKHSLCEKLGISTQALNSRIRGNTMWGYLEKKQLDDFFQTNVNISK